MTIKSRELKNDLRKKFKQIRSKVLPKVEKKIINQVEQYLIKYFNKTQKKGCLGIYWPLPGEINLLHLKQTLNTPLALPATTSEGTLDYHLWQELPLKSDSSKIPSPINEKKLKPTEINLLLVPGIAIDKYGYRLGYGGGFFDRLRTNYKWRSIPSFLVIPQACVSQKPLPKEKWDIPFDGWISEEGLKSKLL